MLLLLLNLLLNSISNSFVMWLSASFKMSIAVEMSVVSKFNSNFINHIIYLYNIFMKKGEGLFLHLCCDMFNISALTTCYAKIILIVVKDIITFITLPTRI